MSPEFDALWRENEVPAHAEADHVKRLHHPTLGLIALEQSAFSVDGRPDLHMIAYHPVDAGQAERIKALIEQS